MRIPLEHKYAIYTERLGIRLQKEHKKMLAELARQAHKSNANIARSILEGCIERRYKRLIKKKSK